MNTDNFDIGQRVYIFNYTNKNIWVYEAKIIEKIRIPDKMIMVEVVANVIGEVAIREKSVIGNSVNIFKSLRDVVIELIKLYDKHYLILRLFNEIKDITL